MGNTIIQNIAVRRDGIWQSVDDGTAGSIHSMTVHEGQLFAGGSTQGQSGSEAWVGRLNGASWDSLGDIHGAMGSIAFSSVHAATYDEGQLVVAGHFRFADDKRVNGIALRSGDAWKPLGTGLGLGYPFGGGNVLGTYNGDLVVGGDFVTAGDEVVNNLARWDGSGWKAFGQGVEWAVYDVIA